MLRRTVSRFAKLLGTSACPPVRTSARLSRFRPTVEALEAREVPAVFNWTGAQNTDANNPYNWSVGGAPGLPGEGDVLHFSSTPSVPIPGQPSPPTSAPDCVGLLSLGEGTSFAAVYIESTYTGTVTIAEALTFGTFQLAGGAISQPDATFSLTVTGTFNWTGGVLNSTPSVANVNLFGGGSITLPGAGGSLVTGSTLTFGSTGGEKLTTISGIGSLLQNCTSSNGMTVLADGKVRVLVDPNGKSWIKDDTAKTLTLKAGSKGWLYEGERDAELEHRVINEGGLFELKQTGQVGLGVKLSGGDANTPSYIQNDNANAKLQFNTSSDLTVVNGARIDGGTVHITQGTSLAPAWMTGNFVMNKGQITYSDPVEIDGVKWFARFKVVGDVTWNGGTFRPGIDATNQNVMNTWEFTGTMTVTVAANNPNKPTIDHVVFFLPAGQQPAGTWYVIKADGANAKIQGNDPQMPAGWTLDPVVDANGNKKKWGIKK